MWKLQTESTLRQEAQFACRSFLALAHQFLPGVEKFFHQSQRREENGIKKKIQLYEVLNLPDAFTKESESLQIFTFHFSLLP